MSHMIDHSKGRAALKSAVDHAISLRVPGRPDAPWVYGAIMALSKSGVQ